jgi:flagellar biosynthesis GTPase FlhF
MSKLFSTLSVLLAGIVITILPVQGFAQSDDAMGDFGGFGRHERGQRREEFLANNPEIAERMQKRKQEMESRRADFESRYPEAASEMKNWVEQDRESRQQMREQMESRRAEFENKYPEAVAEMKAMREEGKEERDERRAEMESRRAEFEAKFPEAAAELRSMRDDLGRKGGGFRRGPGRGDRPHPDI